jgi:hypothetical protein
MSDGRDALIGGKDVYDNMSDHGSRYLKAWCNQTLLTTLLGGVG